MKRSQIYMLIGALLLGSLFALPLWNVTLDAPQYPDSLGMNIYINKFEGAAENDIKNINIMNHYVGMKAIPEQIPEFEIFPYVIGGMILLGILFSFIGNRKLYLLWFVLMAVLGSIGMYDFYQWEYDYGHNLDAHAPIKFTDENGDPLNYQPPLIGTKMILNFKASSMPRIGAYLLFLGMLFSVMAFYTAKKESARMKSASFMTPVILSLFVFVSCQVKPSEIRYGSDACDFCQMTIVDKQHAAQLVTEKGRSYKYDAIECMMNALEKWDRPAVQFHLVADYANPGTLTDAKNAHFLISKEIPSPMGAFLTAFAEASDRKNVHQEAGGDTLGWSDLQQKFNKEVSDASLQ